MSACNSPAIVFGSHSGDGSEMSFGKSQIRLRQSMSFSGRFWGRSRAWDSPRFCKGHIHLDDSISGDFTRDARLSGRSTSRRFGMWSDIYERTAFASHMTSSPNQGTIRKPLRDGQAVSMSMTSAVESDTGSSCNSRASIGFSRSISLQDIRNGHICTN
jgi:hypothetical protein